MLELHYPTVTKTILERQYPGKPTLKVAFGNGHGAIFENSSKLRASLFGTSRWPRSSGQTNYQVHHPTLVELKKKILESRKRECWPVVLSINVFTLFSRPILIYFELRSKPSLLTVIWMDLHSPKKFIATKYCFLILGDDTSFFFFLSFFLCFFIFRFCVMLCYVIYFVIKNFCKNCFRYIVLFIIIYYYYY